MQAAALNGVRLKVCNACCKSNVRKKKKEKERKINIKGINIKEASQSQPASASIPYFIFHTTFNANCAATASARDSICSICLLWQFFLAFLLLVLFFFLGGSIRFFVLVQGDQDRGPPAAAATARVRSADCILGAHSSVPHYGPLPPPFFTKLEHKYNKTQTHTHTRIRTHKLQ